MFSHVHAAVKNNLNFFAACGRQTLCGLLAEHPLPLRRGYPAPPSHQAIRRCWGLPRLLQKTPCNCVGTDAAAHLPLSNLQNCVGRSDLIPSLPPQKHPGPSMEDPGVILLQGISYFTKIFFFTTNPAPVTDRSITAPSSTRLALSPVAGLGSDAGASLPASDARAGIASVLVA